MNIKKEKIKMKIFLIIYIVFVILVFIGASMVIASKVNNAGYAVIPMLFALVFGTLYRNSKKKIEENNK